MLRDPLLRLSLFAAQVIGAATLFRSIAFDRWITVVGSLLILVGIAAARRGRVWGLGLSFAAAAAFPVASAIGIGPVWFWLVGLTGALPFLLSWKKMASFDKSAAALLAGLAVTGGALTALVWKQVAWPIFGAIPALTPSAEAQHGLLLGTIALALGALEARRRFFEIEEARLRIAPQRSRIAESTDLEASEEVDEIETVTPALAARRVASPER